MEYKINQAQIGLNLDSTNHQLKEGQLTYALNAIIENFDGNQITYGNETGNVECVIFPEDYKVIGTKNISTLNRTLYWLTNPSTGNSIIGYSQDNFCTFIELINDINQDCKLGLNIDYPIHKAVIKTTNCSTQVYWTDSLNPRRYIDFDDLPWKEVVDPNNVYKRIKLEGQLDCNKLNVQPDFSVPDITINEVITGGELITGTYQFAIQYSNELGEGYTSYYNVTNPVGIFEDKGSGDFNLPTSKAINFTVENIDGTGLYEWFNIVVVKTINNIATAELIGTFSTASAIKDPVTGLYEFNYTYTGSQKDPIQLTLEEIFVQFPYYDVVGDITTTDDVLIWADLKADEEANYQQIWSNVNLKWETYKIPYSESEAYNDGVNTSNYRGYMRDEVYPFEGYFILKNGKRTKSFHIPGRSASPEDRELIDTNNRDNISIGSDCEDPETREKWRVYNTASRIDFTEEYKEWKAKGQDDNCYIGSYEYGDFAYWESEELYPNNTTIWGNLANTKIKHHKFPDIAISPIHTENINEGDDYKSFEYSIFPIGVRVDINSLYDAINSSNLTKYQKDQIVGFKIARGNRANNKSIIAKGLLNNVGKSIYDNKPYYYPNYPYNDLRPDPYFRTYATDRTSITNLSDGQPIGYNPSKSLDGFNSDSDYGQRFVFHSPDTHFYQPSLSNEGSYLKLEASVYGKSYGHFVPVEDNAMYKFLTPDVLKAAGGIAIGSTITIGAGQFGSPTLNASSAGPTFTAMNEIFEKITPFTNYGYTYHSYGIYGNMAPVTNYYTNLSGRKGWKNRNIDYIKYVTDGANSIEDGNTLNNFRRESSVYIHTTYPLLNATSYRTANNQFPPEDNSRYTISSINDGLSPESIRETNIAAYYGAIKRELLSQWGRMYSYESIDTGYYETLYKVDGGIKLQKDLPIVFGGDIFINRFALKSKLPIFRRNTVGGLNGADIEYNKIGNLNYPMFWVSTKPANYSIDVRQQVDEVIKQFDTSGMTFLGKFAQIFSNITLGGANGATDIQNLIVKLFKEIYQKIGIKNINLDGQDIVGLTEQGIMYLFVYGIPYYFCESEINVDYRQAYNELEGNFYPRVSNDIPDDWLQEKNVSIFHDNTYTYNQSYSKQNKESFIGHLAETFDPEKKCFTEFSNRVIWSDKSNVEETKNNWLVYRPVARFDLPKSYGDFTSIDSLTNKQLLVRFTDKAQIYNALTTVDVSQGPAAVLGNNDLFKSQPLDLAQTDTGFTGSQNKMLLKTEYGNVYVDAARGHVILLGNGGIEKISSKGLDKWLTENLPFNILNYDEDFDIDNHFNKVGLHGVYDTFYQRILITKKDYIPLEGVVIMNNSAYIDTGFSMEEIEIGDPNYFIDMSWTLSYSFKTQSWISFHSYKPNFYIGHSNFFQTGLNNLSISSTWNHNKTFTLFNNFYGENAPYVIEYPFIYGNKEQILQSVKDYSSARVYTDFDSWYEPDEIIYFNKGIIRNNQQCSGVLNFIPNDPNNLNYYSSYPKYNSDSKDIIVTKSDNYYNYNAFWDISVDKSQPNFIGFEINQSNMDYTSQPRQVYPIRGKDAKIRHILDNKNNVKLISRFVITETSISYK